MDFHIISRQVPTKWANHIRCSSHEMATSIFLVAVAKWKKQLGDTRREMGALWRFYEHGWLPLLKRCKSMEEFKQVHAHILKLGLFWDHFCGSNLVATCALAKWGSMEYACSIFRRIEEPSSFEYNTMIRGNVNCMNLEEALILYIEMLKKGIEPDNFTYPFVFKACSLLGALKEGMQIYSHVFKAGLEGDLFLQNSLISMYGKCGAIEHARDVFDKMSERSVASWSAIIGAHASAEMWHECLKLFNDMMHDGRYRPEESTLVSVLSACTHLGSPNLGSSVHGILLRNTTELNVIVKTSLIDMYAKCGCIEKGLCVFHSMAEKNKHSYTVMISGLAVHGRGSEALRIFAEMLEQGLAPDDVVYVGVLSACTHAGLVNEGLEFFNRMQFEHKIEPTIQHYGCMVDLMGRAGMLREAYELIKSMPRKPNDVLWRSLLNACKVHHNLELGEIAAENIFMLNPHNLGDYLVLANMYARAQKWVDMAKIRIEMVQKGLVQTPGFSLVEVKRRVYKFVSHDKSQPHFHSIYAMIHQMEWQLKFEGYIPDTSQVLLDVDEEEKRQRLKYHSQNFKFQQLAKSKGVENHCVIRRRTDPLRRGSYLILKEKIVNLCVVESFEKDAEIGRVQVTTFLQLPAILHPVRDTREKQVQLWKDLILDYCRTQKVFVIGLEEEFPLFSNPIIGRSLTHEAREAFLSALVADGRAEWMDKGHRKCLILWHRIQEWAEILVQFARDNGLEDGVVTMEEIRFGTESQGTELQGIDQTILNRALKILEQKGKLVVFKGTSTDDEGVKFSL
ncbi:hypothetical protein Ahy_Scaffold1g107377 isoform B [Arachis hypogaea]|uniref:ESCRT-II complex subunit VPS25 n=1 Tax=Arachis hypogaea TaxID=3818 RepID=A0A444WVK1_ARAHY|nr:hypothetical protein Ahy_Scaffold1g107377 isoform B [Arachis hypogaea]